MKLAQIIGRDVQWQAAKARLALNIDRDVLVGRLEKLTRRITNPYPADNPISRLDATDDPRERERIRNGL